MYFIFSPYQKGISSLTSILAILKALGSEQEITKTLFGSSAFFSVTNKDMTFQKKHFMFTHFI